MGLKSQFEMSEELIKLKTEQQESSGLKNEQSRTDLWDIRCVSLNVVGILERKKRKQA